MDQPMHCALRQTMIATQTSLLRAGGAPSTLPRRSRRSERQISPCAELSPVLAFRRGLPSAKQQRGGLVTDAVTRQSRVRSSPTLDWGNLSMLAYVMVGSNDLKRSAKFYDAALAPLGLARTGDGERYFGYGPKSAPGDAQFYVTKPYDQKPATFGNGTMISLAAESRRAVDEFHAAAIASGGT